MPSHTIVRTETLSLDRAGRLAQMYVLSPFVWKQDGAFHLLVRAVPRRDDEPRLKIAEVFYGVSADGRRFAMDEAPAIFPGPDANDLDGCEDPTIVRHGGELHVWYTGWNQAAETGRLLRASGAGPRALVKRDVALDSVAGFRNPKEATVVRAADGDWKLFFEFARDEASLVGLANGRQLDGPWTGRELILGPRSESWDSWHVSTGPIVGADTDRPVMFYNGASRDAHWRIGWVAFDRGFTRAVDRGDDPLVVPSDLEEGWTDIAFAASAVEEPDGDIWLYYSIADRALRRALVRLEG